MLIRKNVNNDISKDSPTTDVRRKIEATLANLEVLKSRLAPQTLNPKLPQTHYHVKFGANFNPVTGILKCTFVKILSKDF